MVTIRRATNDDVALFKEVRLKAMRDCPSAYRSTYEASVERDEASWREQLTSTSSGELRNTQFAFDGAKCIGIAALYRDKETRTGDILQMWVESEYRGSTVATSLVQSLLEWAKAIELNSVALSVTDTNGRAI